MECYALAVEDRQTIRKIKTSLEKAGCFDKSKKISADSNGVFQIPIIVDTSITDVRCHITGILPNLNDPVLTKLENSTDFSSFETKLSNLLNSFQPNLKISIDKISIPKRFSIYPPLLLFPANSLDSKDWIEFLNSVDQTLKDAVFKLILNHLSTPTKQLTHLALNKPIPESDNEIRHPTQLITLYGNFNNFWCHTTQNGIYQTWMPIYTMFSRGNIKEKARILNSYKDISIQRDVVDMYAGIGYFTLSYLKRGARRVFCWEINPYSVEGLSKGALKNGFGNAYIVHRDEKINMEKLRSSRCIVFLESNIYCLERFEEIKKEITNFELDISHVNLGLLPTSTDSWPYACKIIDKYGSLKSNLSSWIHVHENIGVNDLDTFMESSKLTLQGLTTTKKIEPIWLEKVKTFAPDVYHIVGDFRLTNL
ncbi:hypothetical protein C6P40_003438 [Pichia californica]|uniref:tRNA wybutosine-synthesizing protein 2 n=1 Tax=Pichia californica TaxID=460514 RepID=A0A9P7BF80_9ASCO|nr:hypothetical protein C6P42_002526 [[Candida] californica]KAG0690242.1 hypothetical protein C6P40_003438 [[Candida] californica]